MSALTPESCRQNCVIGVDPGSHYIGVAVVRNDFKLAYSGVITATGANSKRRVLSFYRHAIKLTRTYHPTYLAIERSLRLDTHEVEVMQWLIGALFTIETLKIHNGVSPAIRLYDSIDVMEGVITGRRSNKKGVRHSVQKILGCRFDTPIEKNGYAGGHDSDAAAVAIYHLKVERGEDE